MSKTLNYGVFGLNQFQLKWTEKSEAIAEAKRLSIKYNRPFSVLVVDCEFECGEEVYE